MIMILIFHKNLENNLTNSQDYLKLILLNCFQNKINYKILKTVLQNKLTKNIMLKNNYYFQLSNNNKYKFSNKKNKIVNK